MQTIHLPPILLPTLTSLLGLTGLAGGLYTFISPLDAIRPFGLIPPPQTPSQPSFPESKNTTSSAQPFHHALIQAYGIRNIGTGLSTLCLTWFWKIQLAGSVAERVTRKCLGICMVMGAVVGVGDAWVVLRFGVDANLKDGDRQEVRGTSRGHAIVSGVILGSGMLLLFG
ncbi:hypothetical protein DE146DRAFT_251318 [Phaeosphaeria sp. MPI-PUGE-AT-0046c]|nr:hypothetical protein DE146DRAFT_251318 [Phaeosphaeria sp. MPI-PUGE-AT-0046c]